MNKDTTVIYHGNCTDGFSAAWAAWRKLGSSASYVPLYHKPFNLQENEHLFKNKKVFILDYSFGLETYLQICDLAESVVLLDHHKSALLKLKNCPGCYFDLNKCGAVIAWDYFHPNEPRPKFLQLVQDMDLGQYRLMESKPFYRSLLLVPKTFEQWDQFLNLDYLHECINKGFLLEELHKAQVLEMSLHAMPVTINGISGLAANAAPMFASDLGDLLAKESQSFGLVWFVEASGEVKCSLRSVASVDCSAIAASFGGGGHPQVSAFYLKELPDLVSILTSK